MQELSFHTDSELHICSWSREIAEITSKSSEVVRGKKYYDVLPRIFIDDKDALSEALCNDTSISLTGYRFNCLFSNITADVAITPISPGHPNDGRLRVAILPSSACSMERKLNQSQQLINIGKIASTLAHGVRNPLNAIKGAVVYLSEKYKEEEPLAEFTRIMEDEISRLETFISKFLSSSVSDTDTKEANINALLKKIEVLTSLQIYTRNIQSWYELGNIPPVTINTFHLEQAILNVINNAIEAMDDGGRLKISTYTEECNGKPFVVIAIADTGQGLPERKVGELALGRKEQGKGFGLFITYEILQHYGGHLDIDSKINSGTTIKLFIPCEGVRHEN